LAHRWGENVLEFGLAAAGATLASRQLEFPQRLWTNGSLQGPEWFDVWIDLGDNLPYSRTTFRKSSFPGLNFPYGFNVFPDGPV